MYNCRGSDVEWVEFFNTTSSEIDISGWYLTDDDVYPAQGEGHTVLPPGTAIGPGEYLVVNLWNHPAFGMWRMPPAVPTTNALPGEVGNLGNGGDNLALYDAATGGNLVDGSLTGEFPDLCSDGRSLEKIDEYFPWGNPAVVAYNFAPSAVPIGFETDLNEGGEFLSAFATPGRGSGNDPGALAYDVEPALPDGVINAHDLLGWIKAGKSFDRASDLLFGFSRHWQSP
jgi:hypothetical protein